MTTLQYGTPCPVCGRAMYTVAADGDRDVISHTNRDLPPCFRARTREES